MEFDQVAFDPFDSHPLASPGQEAWSGASTAWDSNVSRESLQVIRARISDRGFKSSKYADPLLPRDDAARPSKTTAETEERLLKLIKRLEAGSRS